MPAQPHPPLDAARLVWLGILLAVAGAGFFATKGIIIKLALAEGVEPVTMLVWRMVFAVPVFAIVGFIGWRRRSARRAVSDPPVLDGKTLLQCAAIGMMGYYVASFLDFQALAFISAQLDRLILLTYPFFVVLFGAVIFKRRVTPAMIVAQLVSYGGIALIFAVDLQTGGSNVPLGVLLVFVSAVVYAGYQILAKPLIDRIGPGLFTSIAMSAAGPAVVVHFLVTQPLSELAVPASTLPLMLAIGTVSLVVPAYCTSAAIALIGSERTAVIGNVSPVVTIALAVGVLGEAFTPWHAAGTALVFLGVWLFTRRPRPMAGPIDEP